MEDKNKSKKQLLSDLTELRQRITALEASEAEHSRAREALRQSEEHLRSTLETIHAGGWDLDLIDHRAFRSLEHDRIFGYAELLPEWTYEMFLEHVVPEDRAIVDSKFQRAVKNHSDWDFECRIHRVDGQVRWIWAVGRHNRDAAGAPRRMTGIVQDISERKRMEEELKRRERLYRAIGESINYGVWVCAPDGRNIYASESFLKMVGLTQEECSSFGWGNVLHPDDAERTIAAWQECIRTEGIWDIEHRFRGVDGQYHYVLARGIPVRDEQGHIACWAGINLDIDHLKKMEEDLRGSRDELELRVQERTAQLRRQAELLDLAHDAVILRDTDGTISFWSLGAARTYGFTREEAIGKIVHDLLRTKSDPPINDIVDVVRREGRWEGELVHVCKDGTEVYVHSRWALRHDEASGSTEIMEVNRDITLRKKAEQAVRIMGEYNRSLIEASIDPLVTINPEGRISDVNIATERITGYSREKLIGTDFSDYFTEPEKAKAGYRLVFKKGMVKDYELEIRHRDGYVTPVLYNASVYRDEGGHVIGVFAAARDISERKRAGAALKESEERYRTAIENASDGVTLVKGGEHIYVNTRFAEIFGYDDPREIIGKSHALTVHPDDLAKVSEINRMRQRGEPVPSQYEFKGIRKDGTPRDIEVSASRITYRGESVSLVYLRDITDYKNLADQLRQSQKMEAIGTLAGGIAHDFNNMLAAIIGFSEMIEEDLPSDNPGVKYIQGVLNAASRGRDLVKQILAFSRKTEHVRSIVSVYPLIKETIQFLRASLPSTIAIELNNKSTTEDMVLASPVEIQQILMNLGTNAALAMQQKGGILHIGLSDIDLKADSPLIEIGMAPGEYVQLIVKDTGDGMSPDVMQRIFDPFFTTREVGRGTGMGLAVVYGIVKSLYGTIRVESEPGIGSTFTIYLPKVVRRVQTEPVKTAESPRGKERVLFVDDEELLVESSKAMLGRLGYEVTALMDSTEALDIFSSDPSRFDLVITDQTIPHMTGLHLARELLKIRPDIPIILCTGHSDSISLEKAREAGIREFYVKPVGKQELAEMVRRVLDGT